MLRQSTVRLFFSDTTVFSPVTLYFRKSSQEREYRIWNGAIRRSKLRWWSLGIAMHALLTCLFELLRYADADHGVEDVATANGWFWARAVLSLCFLALFWVSYTQNPGSESDGGTAYAVAPASGPAGSPRHAVHSKQSPRERKKHAMKRADTHAAADVHDDQLFASKMLSWMPMVLSLCYAVVIGFSRTSLDTSGTLNVTAAYYHMDVFVGMVVLGSVKVSPLDFVQATSVLFTVVFVWLIVGSAAFSDSSNKFVPEVFVVGVQICILGAMFAGLNYVTDRSLRGRFLLHSKHANLSDQLTALETANASAVASQAASAPQSDTALKQLRKHAIDGKWMEDTAKTLDLLDRAVREGDVRELYYGAHSNNVRVRLRSIAKLQQFLEIGREVLRAAESNPTLAQDARVQRLRTATNAMSVANQWMDKVRLSESGAVPGEAAHRVFLGGSCNPTTWRMHIAMPMLDNLGVTYYNPQVDDWSPDLIEIETKAKATASVLLFVIDGQTRAIVSMNEVTELMCRGRSIVLVVQDIPEGTVVGDAPVSGRELKDLNRGRAYLRELAARSGVPMFATVEEAVNRCVTMLGEDLGDSLTIGPPSGGGPQTVVRLEDVEGSESKSTPKASHAAW